MNMNSGFIRTIVLIVIALLIISAFGLNLKTVADSPMVQSNFGFVKNIALNIWHLYLEKPFMYVWNEVFLKLVWNPVYESLKKDVAPRTTLEGKVPNLNLSLPTSAENIPQ